MTCIVGVAEGRVCIGSDSIFTSVDGDEIRTVTTPKVWRGGGTCCGWSGDWAGVVAMQRLDLSLDDIQQLAKSAKALWVAAGCEPTGVEGLVGRDGRLWYVSDGYAVELTGRRRIGRKRRLRGYGAVGCGAPWAHGALHESDDGNWAPVQRVERALAAAEACCAKVRRSPDGWRIVEV